MLEYYLEKIMKLISIGKRGKPYTRLEQARINEWLELFENIDCLPELVSHIEKINNWYIEKKGFYPPSPNIYDKSILRLFNIEHQKEVTHGAAHKLSSS